MKTWKRIASSFLAAALALTAALPLDVSAAKSQDTVRESSASSYEYQGKWIWSNDAKEIGQWVSFRKEFSLKKVPEKVTARIAVDSKYWLWINGEMAIFEGGVKTGPNRQDMYVDVEDITKYLKTGTNTIAVQAVYFGKNGYGFKDSGWPGFLFDADFGEGALAEGTRIVSDKSWKAIKDPAYQRPDTEPNYRIAEPNILYDVNKELTGWQTGGYDDSAWPKAVEKAPVGRAPYNQLEERPIPQLNVEDIVKYTADGKGGTQTWTWEYGDSSSDVITPLSLPDEYRVTAEFMVEPWKVTSHPPITFTGSLGLTVAMQDANNFYMPQISMANLNNPTLDRASYKPHIREKGNWTTPLGNGDGLVDISPTIPNDQRFSKKHTIVVDVDASGFDATLNGQALPRVATTAHKGGSIGFRNDPDEKVRIYSLKATSKDGKETYFQDTFQQDSGKRTQFKTLEGVAPEIREDEDGTKYLFTTNNIAIGGTVEKGVGVKKYTIRNRTNLQGTPYLKVKSAEEGKRIEMYTDAWYDVNGVSVRHAYLTKVGEQEFEPLGWINGYDVYFEIPEDVEVLELGFRPSTYDTKPAGSFESNDEELNLLYQKSYDTLLVTMRDNYMDCPNRERAQWWGDAVNEMQMAFYAMDENAGLLYKKTLNQTLGWKNEMGQLPTTAPNGIDAISELPMQALAGVMSFWQYYMYSGDKQPVEDGYDTLLNYLKLWDVTQEGEVSHRGGTWDWMDWGSNFDNSIIEACWYYKALDSVRSMAQLLNKPQTDIDFLSERMEAIADSFDGRFWNKKQKAYYKKTGDKKPDDRANALAVYVGLAPESRYEAIRDVLKVQMKSSPYMEKYALEALYMMGYDDEAMTRTKTRYKEMLEDEYPTLWEFWVKADGTPNHAWSGGPLTMMYMFNAGITPLSAAYKDFQIRPLTAGLTDVKASIPSPAGEIAVTIKETADTTTLQVTVPAGSDSADICVPRLDGTPTRISLGDTVIYKDGAAASLPEGVTYKGEDEKYVTFTVRSGAYTFTAAEDEAVSQDTYSVKLDVVGEGTVKLNGTAVDSFPYTTTLDSGAQATVAATPAKGWRLARIIGTYPEKVDVQQEHTSNYTMDRNLTYTAVFEEVPGQKYAVEISAGNSYSASVKVNGVQKYLPFTGRYPAGTKLELEAIPAYDKNYAITGWTGVDSSDGNTAVVTVAEGAAAQEVSLTVEESKNVTTYTGITVERADFALTNSGEWAKDKLVDGNRINVSGSSGFSTNIYDSADIRDMPHSFVLKLPAMKMLNQVSIFPRANAQAAGYRMSNGFPVDFTIAVSADGKNYETVRKVKDHPNPRFLQQVFSFADQKAQYIKITTTKLGAVATDEGSPNNYRIQLAEIEVSYNDQIDLPTKMYLEKLQARAEKLLKDSSYSELDGALRRDMERIYQQAVEVLADGDADRGAVMAAETALEAIMDDVSQALEALAQDTADDMQGSVEDAEIKAEEEQKKAEEAQKREEEAKKKAEEAEKAAAEAKKLADEKAQAAANSQKATEQQRKEAEAAREQAQAAQKAAEAAKKELEAARAQLVKAQAEAKAAKENAEKMAFRGKKVSIGKVTSTKKKQIKAAWKKVAEATGYQVQYSLKSNFKGKKTLNVKGGKKTSGTIKKLKSGKKYYVRVRAYKKIGGKTVYTAFSGKKSVRVK